MIDKIIQITSSWCWMGNYEDSDIAVYGLGESGTLYIQNHHRTYKKDDPTYIDKEWWTWDKVLESPEI